MSHFIGLVFVNTKRYESAEMGLDYMLEPYNEQTSDEDYIVFEDCTEEIQKQFDSLPEVDERLDNDGKPWPYPCDKKNYPTFEKLAENWFGYHKNEDGVYGYSHNPDAKWDWYAIGNRWDGYLYGKDGKTHNELYFKDVDWEKMLTPVKKTYTNFEGKEVEYDDVHIPFCIVDRDGYWHEKGEMGWWACVSNEKDQDAWNEEVKAYVKQLSDLPGTEREDITVVAVDFHI